MPSFGADDGYVRSYVAVRAPRSGSSHMQVELRDLVWLHLTKLDPERTWEQRYEPESEVLAPTTLCGRPVLGNAAYRTIRLCRPCVAAGTVAAFTVLYEQLRSRWEARWPDHPREQALEAWRAYWVVFGQRPVHHG